MSIKIQYPVKIILAWGEAISGNSKLRDWLIANGYPELGIFTFALRNDEGSRKWLLDNGHPHLMAVINGAEGNKIAVAWLEKSKLDILAKVARAADNDDEAMLWLHQLDQKEWFMIAQKIRIVKNDIEYDNNDVHRISVD